MSKSEYLQRLWDSGTQLMQADIEYHPKRGWYAHPTESRWFNDEGEYLGNTYADALYAVEWFVAKSCDHDHLRFLITASRKPVRAEKLLEALKQMASEEHAYWRAKCDHPRNGKRALRALCILLA